MSQRQRCKKLVRVLIVDDDRTLCSVIVDHLGAAGMEVLAAHSAAAARPLLEQTRFDIVLLDQRLPDAEGHTLCPLFVERQPQAKIVFITALPSYEHALLALRSGAHDYLAKPFELGELELMLRKTLHVAELEKLERINTYENRRAQHSMGLVGFDAGLSRTSELVRRGAGSGAPVLITGETGTGKNLVARAIHQESGADPSRFIGINCAALPENLVEAELFGYEKGAFTGATTATPGIFEVADGGTLFLDEIGEMPLHLQTKLLAVLEDKTVRRIGARSSRPVEVRIIAATNSDIDRAVSRHEFREDLYYRLCVLHIHVPPLRERKDDLPALCRHFLQQICGEERSDLPEQEIDALGDYHWPGNVRELRNVLERAVLLSEDGVPRPSQLVKPVNGRAIGAATVAPGPLITLRQAEESLIRQALQRHGGVRVATAATLGVSLSTLKRRIKEYGLNGNAAVH